MSSKHAANQFPNFPLCNWKKGRERAELVLEWMHVSGRVLKSKADLGWVKFPYKDEEVYALVEKHDGDLTLAVREVTAVCSRAKQANLCDDFQLYLKAKDHRYRNQTRKQLGVPRNKSRNKSRNKRKKPASESRKEPDNASESENRYRNRTRQQLGVPRNKSRSKRRKPASESDSESDKASESEKDSESDNRSESENTSSQDADGESSGSDSFVDKAAERSSQVRSNPHRRANGEENAVALHLAIGLHNFTMGNGRVTKQRVVAAAKRFDGCEAASFHELASKMPEQQFVELRIRRDEELGRTSRETEAETVERRRRDREEEATAEEAVSGQSGSQSSSTRRSSPDALKRGPSRRVASRGGSRQSKRTKATAAKVTAEKVSAEAATSVRRVVYAVNCHDADCEWTICGF